MTGNSPKVRKEKAYASPSVCLDLTNEYDIKCKEDQQGFNVCPEIDDACIIIELYSMCYFVYFKREKVNFFIFQIGVSLHPELEASLLEQLEHSMKECVENTYVYITNPTDVSFKDQTHEIVFLKEAIENLKLEVQDKNQEIENYKGQEIENRKNILEFQKIQSENEKLKRANAYLHQRVQDLEHKSVEFGHGPPVAQSNNVMLEELKKQFEQQKMANVTLHKEVQRLNEKLEEVITDNERLMSENFEAGRKLKSIESKENDKVGTLCSTGILNLFLERPPKHIRKESKEQ